MNQLLVISVINFSANEEKTSYVSWYSFNCITFDIHHYETWTCTQCL